MSQECLLTEWIRKEVIERMEGRPTPFSFGDIQREIIEEASKQINFTITNYAKMFEMMG
jgi:hypothetical protein